jgi:hypothetical protein
MNARILVLACFQPIKHWVQSHYLYKQQLCWQVFQEPVSGIPKEFFSLVVRWRQIKSGELIVLQQLCEWQYSVRVTSLESSILLISPISFENQFCFFYTTKIRSCFFMATQICELFFETTTHLTHFAFCKMSSTFITDNTSCCQKGEFGKTSMNCWRDRYYSSTTL